MGPDARKGQAAANRPFFMGPLIKEVLPAIPEIDAALRAGGRVADIGCGLGWSSIGIATGYPEARVDGFDVDVPSIERARQFAEEAGVADRVTSSLRLVRPGGTVLVVDEKVAETFTAPGDEVERLMYGYSLTCCLPDASSTEPSARTGTVMRPATLERYAREAGFAGLTVLPIDHDFFRFYLLTSG
jgi:SAM-dependent methyltransferase